MFYGYKIKHFLHQFQKKQYFFGINSIKSITFWEYVPKNNTFKE